MATPIPITELLQRWRAGDRAALDQLVPLVYDQLRRLAASHLRRETSVSTLDPTALVHEAYLRMIKGRDPECSDRAHFLGIAARLMREILVDRARARQAHKRNGGVRVLFDEELDSSARKSGDNGRLLMKLDDALVALEERDAEKARILELKYFGGLVAEETAELLGVPVKRVNRQMVLAQAWLRREMAREKKSPTARIPTTESA